MAARKRASRQADDVELANLPPISPAPVASDDAGVMLVGAPMASAADIRAERELDDLLQELGSGDVSVTIRRRSPSGSMQSCGTMPAKDFTVDALTDAYGGGSYSLRFMRGRSEVGRTTVDVDPLIPARNPRAPGVMPTVAAAPGMPSEFMAMMTGMMGMMFQSMQAQSQGTLTMISGMAEMMKARPSENPMDLAIRMAEMMKGRDGAPSVTELFGILEKGMNLGARMNGGDDSDGVMPLVGEGVKGVVALMEGISAEKKAAAARMTAETPSAPPPPAIPSGQPVAVVAPPAPAPTAMTARPWVAAVLPFKEQLAGMIGLFTPSAVAPMLMEKLSDEQLDDLLADIEDQTEPGFVLRTWMLLRPGIAATQQQVQWLADVAVAVVESTESEEVLEPDNNGGDTGNAAVES